MARNKSEQGPAPVETSLGPVTPMRDRVMEYARVCNAWLLFRAFENECLDAFDRLAPRTQAWLDSTRSINLRRIQNHYGAIDAA